MEGLWCEMMGELNPGGVELNLMFNREKYDHFNLSLPFFSVTTCGLPTDEGAVPVIMQPTTWKNILWVWPEATALISTLDTRRCCCFHPFPSFRGFSAHWGFSSSHVYTLWPSSLRLLFYSQRRLRARRMKNEQPSHLIQFQSSLIEEQGKKNTLVPFKQLFA